MVKVICGREAPWTILEGKMRGKTARCTRTKMSGREQDGGGVKGGDDGNMFEALW